MNRNPPNASLQAARRRFFDSGDAPRGLVPDTILESWQRCAGFGLSAEMRPRVEPMTQGEMSELTDRFEALRRLCRPELESLYADARGTGSIVTLASPDGVVLDALGSADFLDKASRVALRPGVMWSERHTGTNAIGTALVERRPVEVRGAEHYFAPHRILSCSASPIIDPYGRLAGVLDLSGESSVHHMHALGMVRFAVDHIEHRLFAETSREWSLLLRLHSDPALLGTAREGLLAFRDHRLVAANRHALELFGLSWDELGRRRYDELIASPMPRTDAMTCLRDHVGTTLYARVDRVGDLVPARTDPAPPSRPRAAAVVAAGERVTPRAPRPAFNAVASAQLDRSVRLLNANVPILLQGETGSGKEVFARELHRRSARAGGKFVAVNCAAIPEGLIEAELFGYVGGAFTGARKEGASGVLREADGGVLFLDEIGDMPVSLQSRLLRVLQEYEVAPLGGGRAVTVDFAVICATHCDLDTAVEEKRFRADLFFRIAQHAVHLPALRDHEDRAGVIRSFWQQLGCDATGLALSDAAVDCLAAASWPGNFRQLVGVLRSLQVLGEPGGVVDVGDLPESLRRARGAVSAVAFDGAELSDIALAAMESALSACNGNVSAAAKQLGISRSTLYRRLRLES
ncbi:sigma-54-dependent Fis family transcriptional regulator [Dokdonella sp. MW10]|uniref:sigma-54-dependent Fis family transcriptional regulator n=1 Tax=Dokdonella sp. MW10 TaxID=2992926 RepID=UPI003F7FDB82